MKISVSEKSLDIEEKESNLDCENKVEKISNDPPVKIPYLDGQLLFKKDSVLCEPE